MQQNVVFAYTFEKIGAFFHGFWHARIEAGEFQFRAFNQVGYLHQPHQIHRAVDAVDIVIAQCELLLQLVLQGGRTAFGYFETHGVAKVALRQLTLQRGAQILYFLFL